MGEAHRSLPGRRTFGAVAAGVGLALILSACSVGPAVGHFRGHDRFRPRQRIPGGGFGGFHRKPDPCGDLCRCPERRGSGGRYQAEYRLTRGLL